MEENPTEEKIDGGDRAWLVEECRKRGFTAPPFQIHVNSPSGKNVSVVVTKTSLEDPQNAMTGVRRYKELLGGGLPRTKKMNEEQLRALLKLVLQDPRFAEGSPVVSPAFFNRSAQDLFCVVLFWAYWIGMCILAAVAYSTGDPLRLVDFSLFFTVFSSFFTVFHCILPYFSFFSQVRPTDYQGNACDDTTLATTNGRPNLMYPRIAEDAESMMQTQDAACASSGRQHTQSSSNLINMPLTDSVRLQRRVASTGSALRNARCRARSSATTKPKAKSTRFQRQNVRQQRSSGQPIVKAAGSTE